MHKKLQKETIAGATQTINSSELVVLRLPHPDNNVFIGRAGRSGCFEAF